MSNNPTRNCAYGPIWAETIAQTPSYPPFPRLQAALGDAQGRCCFKPGPI